MQAAEEELQRMSSEETHASHAIALVQRETALRAGWLGEQAHFVHAEYQQERAAFQRLQEEASLQQRAMQDRVGQMRTECGHAERVFEQLQLRDSANQSELLQLQKAVFSGQRSADQVGRFEAAMQSSFAHVRG
jgi:DNA-directed RNA polymerase subunit M/transcription elongation factor TFIIS